ncbi:acylneuraminate cytidylyltransferase [Solidesulfovibrio carbinoliphilus subsp. oakridgensis]|uniref:Acylneuraminate cytidylyltransferase n=1 Tax=Solidesulfovibrio carbinoliphilus subsp. oakridgensis TaxID=694327 RepID=G7Q7S9_9BACT|nr:acylneuraminate cytidylyltransferase [Solidesulfovibrio carbinoliphilus]EHJ47388.1 acylneuraminate cytidylyltransferase [Solidesulfovibrio carbinoliphilus subsp. oakridgensis]
MNIGALVPARLGSRRLPRKNILPFHGRPLLCRTLDVLLDSNVFCDVTVSTESEEVAAVVREHYPAGDVAVLIRPDSLAGDDAPLARVADHYMEARPRLHWGGLFMPTFPFRRAGRLVEAAAAIHTGYPLRVQAVRPEQHWDQDYFFPHGGGFAPVFAGFPTLLRFSSTSYMLWRRETPQCTAMRLGYRLSEREHRLRIDLEETVDIDTPADLDLALRLAAGARLTQTPVATRTHGPWFVQAPATATDADVAAFLDWLGPDLLADPTAPLLLLQKPEPPLFTARLAIDLAELHFLNPTAQDHTWSPRYVTTANTAHCLPVYQQSPIWRLVARDTPLLAPPCPVSRAGLGQPIAAEERLVPAGRVRFVEDMAGLPFYQGAYTVAG